jgi:hypothetical protein
MNPAEPPAGFAPAPSSLPRKRPDSGTARALCPRRDSNAHYPAPRAGASCQVGLRGHGVVDTEPPSGADPDRPPYEGGAAAVRGGEKASGGGLEPPMARVRALLGTPTPHPEPRTGGEIRTRKRPGLSRPGIPSSRHARVPPRGLEPLHARLRVWCPARRAQAAYWSEWPGSKPPRPSPAQRRPLAYITLERIRGIEPRSSAWRAAALPLSYIRLVAPAGNDPACSRFSARR